MTLARALHHLKQASRQASHQPANNYRSTLFVNQDYCDERATEAKAYQTAI